MGENKDGSGSQGLERNASERTTKGRRWSDGMSSCAGWIVVASWVLLRMAWGFERSSYSSGLSTADYDVDDDDDDGDKAVAQV